MRVSICQFRGIGQHYHALMQESGEGRSFAGKFSTRMAAETWVMQMARRHFPVRRYKIGARLPGRAMVLPLGR